jgi:hypothetical protein
VREQVILRFFATATGKALCTFALPRTSDWPSLDEMYLSPDGRRLVYPEQDGAFALVDVATGKKVRAAGEWPYHLEKFRAPHLCAFAADSSWFVALPFSIYGRIGPHSTARIWDVPTGAEVRRFVLRKPPGGELADIRQFALSPDRRLLAVCLHGDPAVYLWEVASGQVRGKLSGHDGHAWELAFSPDGAVLASSASDTTVLIWDLRRPLSGKHIPAGPRTPAELEALWQDLADLDAARAGDALCALAAADQGVSFLKGRLRPVPTPPAGRIEQLIADLNHKSFKVRQQAEAELVALQELAIPVVGKAQARPDLSLEMTRRLQTVRSKLPQPTEPPACLRELRALEVLERVGTAEAREVVQAVVAGAPGARLTREANDCLRRLQATAK